MTGFGARAFKRFFDIATALIGIAITGWAMILCAVWIKTDSRGPVFFRQERVGRDGQLDRKSVV